MAYALPDGRPLLKFAKSVPYLIDPAPARPPITEDQKRAAAEQPPRVIPHHCKPWVDGQSVGWVLSYGYITPVAIRTAANGRIDVENGARLVEETQQPRIIDQFADEHFGIGTGLTLRTPPGFVSMIIPAINPPSQLRALTGILETDWYPRQLFLVFELPTPAMTIRLDRGMSLARVVVIPRQIGVAATPVDPTELADIQTAAEAYVTAEARSPSRWTAAGGDTFTHLYKQWSQQWAQTGQVPPETP